MWYAQIPFTFNPITLYCIYEAILSAYQSKDDPEAKNPKVAYTGVKVLCGVDLFLTYFRIGGFSYTLFSSPLDNDIPIGVQQVCHPLAGIWIFLSIGWAATNICFANAWLSKFEGRRKYITWCFCRGYVIGTLFLFILNSPTPIEDAPKLQNIVIFSIVCDITVGQQFRYAVRNCGDSVNPNMVITHALPGFLLFSFAKKITVLRIVSSLYLTACGALLACIEILTRTTSAYRDKFFALCCRRKNDTLISGGVSMQSRAALAAMEVCTNCLETIFVLPMQVFFILADNRGLDLKPVPIAAKLYNIFVNYVAEFVADVVVVRFGPAKAFNEGFQIVEGRKNELGATAVSQLVAWLQSFVLI